MLSKAYKCPKEKFPHKQTKNNTHPRRGIVCLIKKKPLPSSSFIIHISILLIYYKKQKDKILTV